MKFPWFVVSIKEGWGEDCWFVSAEELGVLIMFLLWIRLDLIQNCQNEEIYAHVQNSDHFASKILQALPQLNLRNCLQSKLFSFILFEDFIFICLLMCVSICTSVVGAGVRTEVITSLGAELQVL